mmetsp:Transcript_1487/g.4022  ORF Transcript_1487/g.4022 Transcript_1487/m.4022 type:complete len:261 (-) Transcript_1487:108-890(-)
MPRVGFAHEDKSRPELHRPTQLPHAPLQLKNAVGDKEHNRAALRQDASHASLQLRAGRVIRVDHELLRRRECPKPRPGFPQEHEHGDDGVLRIVLGVRDEDVVATRCSAPRPLPGLKGRPTPACPPLLRMGRRRLRIRKAGALARVLGVARPAPARVCQPWPHPNGKLLVGGRSLVPAHAGNRALAVVHHVKLRGPRNLDLKSESISSAACVFRFTSLAAVRAQPRCAFVDGVGLRQPVELAAVGGGQQEAGHWNANKSP